jgi:hypothetical protein
MNKIAKNLERFKIAINSHDRINPDHSPAYGIGVSAFDLERLEFDDGEELWPGIKIEIDGGTSGNFRVLCNGSEHNKEVNQEDAIGIFV